MTIGENREVLLRPLIPGEEWRSSGRLCSDFVLARFSGKLIAFNEIGA